MSFSRMTVERRLGLRISGVRSVDRDTPSELALGLRVQTGVMKITPAVGVPGVSIGDTKTAVQASLGAPSSGDERRDYYFDSDPGFAVHYDADQLVEFIEAYHSQGRGEVYLDDIQLIFRLMDDVVADLTQRGYTGKPIDIGYQFDEGFTIWSMASQSPSDLTPGAEFDPEDGRLVVEGVGIAPIAYWED